MEDGVPSNDRCGQAPSDDDNYARNGEEAIAPNDTIDGMGQQAWVARASGVRMPKQARGDVPEEGETAAMWSSLSQRYTVLAYEEGGEPCVPNGSRLSCGAQLGC